MKQAGTKQAGKKHRENIRQQVLLMVDSFGSQAALADIADVKPPAVHYWTTGAKRPGLRSLLRIQKASGGRFVASEIRPELF